MDRVTYTPPTSELPLVGPDESADAVPDGHQRSPFVELDRQTWSRLSTEIDVPLTAQEIENLRGLGDRLDVDEVREVYLPLSRLLTLYDMSSTQLNAATNSFLGEHHARTPFVIDILGHGVEQAPRSSLG